MAILSIDELRKFLLDNKSNFTRMLKFYHNDLYVLIDTKYHYETFTQKLYHYINTDITGKCYNCDKLSVFDGINKGYRKYCSYQCSGIGKTIESRVDRICAICNTSFNVYKKDKKRFCSDTCRLVQNRLNVKERITKSNETSKRNHGGIHHLSLPEHRIKSNNTKLIKYGDVNYNNQEKNKLTKIKRYDNPNYNNPEKNAETVLKRYGVCNIFHLYKSNGIRISKPQREYFEYIQKDYPDAILEHYLSDVHISVDIFIPSINKIIEIYGDYWHCNPNRFLAEDYHDQLHMTAKEKWELDLIRKNKLEAAGYIVEVLWESDIYNRH